jgi:hypothetical protein
MKKQLQFISVIVVVICLFIGVVGSVDALTKGILDGNKNTAGQIGAIGFEEKQSDSNLTARVATIVRVAVTMIGAIIVFYIAYAGFLWTTAGGNSDQVGKAKTMMVQAIIGMAIVMSAYAITSYVINYVVRSNMTEEPTLNRQDVVKDGLFTGYGDPNADPDK